MATDAKDDARSELQKEIAALTPEQRAAAAEALTKVMLALMRAVYHARHLEAVGAMFEGETQTKH